jgi:SAM-dependent methyltransferase
MRADADRIVDLYERHADAFDRLRGRGLFERAWLDRFLAGLPDAATVLDIGCGMGEPIARYLIEQGCALAGVDSSSSLIARCTDRFPQHDWHVADMRTLDLRRRFDGLLAWDSFFHLHADDQRRMFPVFARHAADQAILMFTSGPSRSEAVGTFEGEPLYHASLDPDEYRALLRQHDFRVVAHVVEDVTCQGHTVWLAQRL